MIAPGRGLLEGREPTYAPNGREIAFVKETPVGFQIWISSVDGRNLRQVPTVPVAGPISGPTWSPDGLRIAFTTGGADVADIWTVSPDGSNLTRLTTDLGKGERPAWSPDGSQIAFVSKRLGSYDIWLMDAGGTHPRKVTALPHQRGANHPAFSPDGRRIVFTSQPDDRLGNPPSNLFIIHADGTGLCQLTTGDFYDWHPQWSSRGIVFDTSRTSYSQGIWIVQPDGSELQPVAEAHGGNPAWSPDSTRIAFDDYEYIYVVNLLDRTVKPLTQFNVVPIVIYIKPGHGNTIDPKTERKIPVAILSAPWFDPVRQIDQGSITFGPTGDEGSLISCAEGDVNEDGVPDLVCDFDAGARFSSADTEGILRAKGVSEMLFEGRDAVRVLSTP